LLEQLRPTPKWPVSLSVVVTRARDRKLGVRAGLLNDVKPTPVGLRLTTREREVFRLLCLGLTNKEIAQRLFITEVTAKAHVRNILSKLGVRSRTEAVLRAQADE
jgi:DNA-binding NarL/FixJ family response regulator